MGRRNDMRQQFIEAGSRYEAMQAFDFPVAKVVKVEGGYHGFESMEDYRVWRQQK